jgi:hypothetical protein
LDFFVSEWEIPITCGATEKKKRGDRFQCNVLRRALPLSYKRSVTSARPGFDPGDHGVISAIFNDEALEISS